MEFKKQLVKLIGFPLAIIVLMMAAMFFLNLDISKRSGRIEQVRGDLNYRLRTVQSLILLRWDASRAEPYLKVFDYLLLERDEMVNFARELKEIGRESGVDLSVGLGGETTGADFNYIGFGVSAEASFEDLTNLLKNIEKSRYFIRFDSFDFIKFPKGVKGSFSGQVFFNGQSQ